MKYAKRLFYLLSSLIVLALSACGGDPAFNEGGCNAADTPTNISSVAIVGSTTVGGTEVINDSADFSVSWDLTSSCTYTYKLYLAVTNTRTPGIDVEVASGTCGLGYTCTGIVDFDCSFDSTAKTLSCNGGSAVSVSSLLPDPGPASRYFILSASNEMMDNDTMATNQVRIDF